MDSLVIARRGGLDSVAVDACLRDAMAAPSIHNSQPWRFRLWSRGFEILVDPRRRLDAIDRDGRAATISVGAALFNLRIAVLRRGRIPVLRIGSGASIEVGPAASPDATVRALSEAIGRRRTNRSPFADTVVPAEVVDELRAAARAEGATLTSLDPVRRDAVLALTRTADERQRTDPDYRHELTAWTQPEPGRRDGIPTEAYGPVDASGTFPVRDFGLGRPGRYRRAVHFEPHPRLMLLQTHGDGYRERLCAGQALQRVLLTATVRGVSTQPITQALEEPALRQLITDPGGGRTAQMILRIGYGLPAAASPRRHTFESLDEADE